MERLSINVMLDASASYKDLVGKSELAWDIDEHTALEEIAKKCNIDVYTYEPIGLHLGLYEDSFGLTLYIASKQSNLNGKKKVKSVLTGMTNSEFFALVKDLSVSLFKPFEDHDSLYQYEGEDELENYTTS